jgi:hypothetical protein
MSGGPAFPWRTRPGLSCPALADDHPGPTLAVLNGVAATVNAFLANVGGLRVATEVAAIDLGNLDLAADRAALQFLCHCLTELMEQFKRGLMRARVPTSRAAVVLDDDDCAEPAHSQGARPPGRDA